MVEIVVMVVVMVTMVAMVLVVKQLLMNYKARLYSVMMWSGGSVVWH